MTVNVLELLTINIILFLSALFICFKLKVKKGAIVFVSTLVVYFSLIIVFLTGLGIFNILNLRNYVFLTLIVFALLILTTKGLGADIRNLVAGFKTYFRSIPGFIKIIILIMVFLFIFWLVRLALVPIWDYDSLAFHMPFVANMIQTQSVNDVYFSALSGAIGYYPLNIEVILTSFTLFLGSDNFLNSLNLVFALCLFFVCYLTFRELNASKKISAFATLAFLSLPVVVRQIGTLKIDIFFMFMFASLILFLIRYAKNKNISDLILFSLSGGMFLGSRYLAIPYLVLPLIFMAILIVGNFKKNGKKTISHLMLSGFLVLLLGGYWYIRNFIITGNPIFPTAILGFPGLKNTFSGGLFSTAIINSFDRIIEFIEGFSIETGITVVLSLISWFFVLGLLIRKKFENKLIPLFLLIGLPLYILFYILSPNSALHFDQNIRYVLPGLFLEPLLIGFIAKTKRSENIVVALLIVAILINFGLLMRINRPQEILGYDLKRNASRGELLYEKLSQTYGSSSSVFQAMSWLDKNIPQDAKIGYSGFHLHYPLFGLSLQRNVDYITLGPCFDCNYYDFIDSDGNIFANKSFDAWLGNIYYYQKQYYVFFNQFNGPEPEKQWLNKNPRLFELLYQAENASVYKVIYP